MSKHVLFIRIKDYSIWWHYSKLNKVFFALAYSIIIGWYAFLIGLIVGVLTECIIKKDYKIPRPASEYITFARLLSVAVGGKLNKSQQYQIQQIVREFFPNIQVSAFWFNFYDQIKVKTLSKYLIAQWTTYLAYSNYKIEEALQTVIDYDKSGQDQSKFIQYWNTQLSITLQAERQKKDRHSFSRAYSKTVASDMETLNILELAFPKTVQELKTIYVQRLKDVHPDTASIKKENVGEQLKEIKNAYERLKILIQNGESIN